MPNGIRPKAGIQAPMCLVVSYFCIPAFPVLLVHDRGPMPWPPASLFMLGLDPRLRGENIFIFWTFVRTRTDSVPIWDQPVCSSFLKMSRIIWTP